MTTDRRKPRLFPRLTALLFSFAALAIPLYAQSNRGTIVGTVTDPNGAVVRDARVTVVNVGTGETKEATTAEDGTYSVPALDPGRYRVTIDATGFQSAVVEEVVVETNARQPVDIALTAGGVAGGVVTVTSDAPLVETETSVRGDVITGRQVVDLPIPQRNFTLLAQLSPGVTRPVQDILGGGGNFSGNPEGVGQASTESTRFRESGGSVISANGQRVTNNNFTLDGVDNNESQFGQIGIYPSPDAIAEFKVETSVPSAESGRAGGAIVSTTFKSGTNGVHGTLYEFYQGRFASAKPTNNANPPNFVTHNFGGTVGGPIFLPRPGEGGSPIYDGRNKSFFFFNYNGQRNGTPAFGGEFNFVRVPSVRQRAGDFSELLEPGVLVTYNTVRGPVVAPRGTIFDAAGFPFPGNIIPQSLINPVASAVLNAYPLPTTPGLEDNFRRNRSERANVDAYDIKLDHNAGVFGAATAFFGRYSKSKNTRARDNNFPLGSSPNGNDLASGFGAGEEFGNSRQVALGAATTFTPTVINDMRAGYTRVEIGIFNPGVGGALGFSATNASDLGIQNTNICGVVCSGTVLLGITGTGPRQNDYEFIGDGGPFFFTSNNFFFGDTLTVVRGNQIYKFGGDIRVRQNVQQDSNNAGGSKGNFVFTTGARVTRADGTVEGLNRNGFFSGRETLPVGPADAGNGAANFLLGYSPTELSRGINSGIPFLSSKEISFFVQDDWKVNPDLTLNLGLRYDVFTAPTERFDRQSNFDPATGLLVRTTDGSPNGRSGIETDKNNFGPRIGFAWSGLREDKRFVIRGGYGILYSTDVSGQQPLSANFLGGARFDRAVLLPGINIQTGAPFPALTEPTSATYAPSPGARIFFNDPNAETEIFHQYNLTAQWEFWPNWLAEAAYVGTRARNLLVVRNIGTGGGPGSREISNIDQVTLIENTGSSWYDALQTKLEKRFSNGLSILSAYTWAHAIDNTPGGFCIPGPDVGGRQCGPSNPVIGLSIDKGNSDLDVRHRFTFANVWDLPFGRGRRFGSDLPTGLDVVVGGWQFNNVVTIQSGPVYSVFANGARVDIIGDPFANLANGLELNRAAFRAATTPVFASLPNGPKFGNLGRNVFRGQRQEYWDASLFKNIPVSSISEEFAVQLRFQFYNVLNHINHFRPERNLTNNEFGLDKSTQRARQSEFSIKILF
jgi:hypothetical protein